MKAEACAVEGCGRSARAKDGGLCFGHAWRKRVGLELDAELRPWGQPLETLRRAAEAYNAVESDSESDAQFARASARLKMAGYRMGAKHTRQRLARGRR